CVSCDQSIQKLAFYEGKCYTQNFPPDNTFCDWNRLACTKCNDSSCLSCSDPSKPPQVYSSCLSCSDPTKPPQECLSCIFSQTQILYLGKCFTESLPPSKAFCDWKKINTFCDWNKLICTKCYDSSCLSCSDPSKPPQLCTLCYANQILYQGKCYSQNSSPSNTFCDWNKLQCFQCTDSNCLSCNINCFFCSDPNQKPSLCLTCDASQKQAIYEGKCYTLNSPPNNTFCDWNKLTCTKCSDSSCFSCSDPSKPPQVCLKLCLSCDQSNQKLAIYEGKCYTQNSPPNNTFCDWNKLACTKCNDSSCLSCSDPYKPPQVCLQYRKCLTCSDPSQTSSECLKCDAQQKQILYQGKCYTKDSPPNNTFCDWNNLKCSQCSDTSCLICTCSEPNSQPQKCLTCQVNQILYKDKCFTKDSPPSNTPPSNTYCDWINFNCTQCENVNCLTCSDPNLTPSYCLSCQDKEILYKGQCYKENNPPSNAYCDWSKLECLPCKDINCLTCSNPNQIEQYCLSCPKQQPYLFLGRCYCGNGFFGTNCKQSCNHSCILCQDNLSCDKYSDERIYKNQDCHFSCSKCYIPSKTYGCEQCGSNTRELQKITGTCICKTGFREIGEAECKDEKFLEPNKEVQNTNNKIIQALFFINLPQLFINIHPYGDFFLFQMQQLGNFYFQNQNSTTSPFKSFTILNFFNIYYQKPQAQDKTTEIVFGIAFKSNVDKTSSQNLLLLTIILILFALFSIITLPQTQTIDYSSKQFKNPPLVIVGIGFYNNKFDPKDKQILFELTSSSITNSQCDIQLISDAATSYLTGIQANVLVIDKSQFPFVNVIYQKQQNINFDNNYQFQEKRQYSLNLQGNKSAIVIIRGWKSSSKTSSNSSFSLHVFVQNIDDQNYTITITTSKSSLTIIDVYYTIIEYQTNPTSQYGIISNYDQSYQSPTKQTCFSSKSCKNEKRYFPVNFKVVNIQKISSPYYNFFISINQFQFTTENYETDPRLELTKQQINKDTINYSYHTWDDSICTGSTTSSLFFYRKVCQNNQYFNIIANTCISSCQITNPQNNQLCLDCSSGQYFLQDKQICQSKKPAGYICSQINSFYTCQNCKIDNCQECQDVGSSQFNCVQCLSQYYLYKNQCSIKQPDNTNCNDKFICSACNDTNCLKCILNSSNDQQCLDCPSGQYFLQDKQTCQSEKPAGYICSQINNPPNNAYCDWVNLKCQQCDDINCLICSDPNIYPQQCSQCQSNYILYNNKCYAKDNPPNNAYCDWVNLKCQQCDDINCLICSDPNIYPQKCLKCQSNQILYNNVCYTQTNPPNNTYCDWENLECFQCKDIDCLTCSNPNLNLQQCLSCQTNQILYDGKCYTKSNPPNNTYCDWINFKCLPCKDKSCQTCSDPNQQEQYCLSCQKESPYLFYGKCYCGKGFFGIDCKQSCIQSCILCQDSLSCDKYSDERIYQKEDCHFSCQKCYIPNKDYACQECSSETRELEQMTGSCFCKAGYTDIGIAECQDNKALKPNDNFSSTSSQILYFYLDQKLLLHLLSTLFFGTLNQN
ncbi:hypothetical protein ABPG73_003929, partial [Tetrahymena malaccensis]